MLVEVKACWKAAPTKVCADALGRTVSMIAPRSRAVRLELERSIGRSLGLVS